VVFLGAWGGGGGAPPPPPRPEVARFAAELLQAE
jgi:hypothetical protein